MSYLVLARKWRPHSFAEVVGQEHVVRALVNGLNKQRLHHAFLLTGTRGIGKTTIARILAKSLNCESGVSAEPCGTCQICRDVDDGRFFDLIEIDAASRTGVDDMRELLDNVQYAPTRGRCKVYLIDEVHMLSNSSFNALLKTLEEPPEHVKFILATTDPQKLPPTVLSRCLQFHLKRLTRGQLVGQLRHILEAEEIEAEPAAIERLAHAADGSMRDALSLLDQAIAHGGGKVEAEAVRQMLGTVDGDQAMALLQSVLADDAQAALAQIDDLSAKTPNFAGLLEELATLLHRLALIQYLGAGQDGEDELGRMAAEVEPETVQLYYEIALRGRRDLPLAPAPRVGVEMTLLRMLAFRPQDEQTVAQPPVTAAGRQEPASNQQPARPQPAPVEGPDIGTRPSTLAPEVGAGISCRPPADAPDSEGAPGDGVAEAPATVRTAPTTAMDPASWERLIGEMGLLGPVRLLAAHSSGLHLGETGWRLELGSDSQSMLNDMVKQRLEDALNEHFSVQHRLRMEITSESLATPDSRRAGRVESEQKRAEQALAEDPVAQQLQAKLGARVLENSTQPR